MIKMSMCRISRLLGISGFVDAKDNDNDIMIMIYDNQVDNGRRS